MSVTTLVPALFEIEHRKMPKTVLPPMIGAVFGEDTPRARRSDPITSHEAADTNDVAVSIGAVLAVLRREGPFTDQQLILAMQADAVWNDTAQWSEQRIRTARSALVKARRVVRVGYGVTFAGRRTQIWQAVAE